MMKTLSGPISDNRGSLFWAVIVVPQWANQGNSKCYGMWRRDRFSQVFIYLFIFNSKLGKIKWMVWMFWGGADELAISQRCISFQEMHKQIIQWQCDICIWSLLLLANRVKNSSLTQPFNIHAHLLFALFLIWLNAICISAQQAVYLHFGDTVLMFSFFYLTQWGRRFSFFATAGFNVCHETPAAGRIPL